MAANNGREKVVFASNPNKSMALAAIFGREIVMPQQLDLFRSHKSEADPHGNAARAERRRLLRKFAPDMINKGGRPRNDAVRYDAAGKRLLPFVGVDGEGGGTDEYGRQNFLLLRAGDQELFNGNRPLETEECLEFLLSLPKDAIYVGYYFNYDATMILRDLPEDRIQRLFAPRAYGDARGHGRSNMTWWGRYAIDYVPRQSFTVARLNRGTLKIVPNSSRTINEVGGFFQSAYVKALSDWSETLSLDKRVFDKIVAGKERRESFDQLDKAEREYCRLECETLAALMEKFRETCMDAAIVPQKWRGAGWLASALHTKYKTAKPEKEGVLRPAALEKMSLDAYYGGRFEVTRIGAIPGPVYEYDINSAYPAAMLHLPCPLHSRWRKGKDIDQPGVYDVTFSHGTQNICNLPIRRKGHLFWPSSGRGTYYHSEIQAATRAGTRIERVWDGRHCELRCTCQSFEWIQELYRFRRTIGKSTRGYPIKLGLNALYGKLAQREGAAPFRDRLAAGMITAWTRARLIDAYRQAPDDCIMLATDGIYMTAPLDLDIGEDLGQWEHKEHPAGMFIVQPGIYWSDTGTPKTRGVPRARIVAYRDDFIREWSNWLRMPEQQPPEVVVEIPAFIGLRLALHRIDPQAAGKWLRLQKHISFNWQHKRDPIDYVIRGQTVVTKPYEGSPLLQSEPYSGDQSMLYEQMLENEAMPDHYEMNIGAGEL